MTQEQKKKLCWNCDGSAPYENDNCPYCGVYLSSLDGKGSQNLFAPPYKLNPIAKDQQIPASPYAVQEPSRSEATVAPSPIEKAPQTPFLPLCLLSAGFMLTLFGIALFLFSKNGTLTLRWDATLWFLYLILGLPSLLFGWRLFLNLKDE